MKLVTFHFQCKDHLGIFHAGKVYPLQRIDHAIADNMLDFLKQGELVMNRAKELNERIMAGSYAEFAVPLEMGVLKAPVPHPTSCRDGYAFRQHVEAARRNRGVEMIPEFDQYPIFYFTNHNAVQGPGDVYCMPDHFDKLDFELEAAIVVGRKGRNIRAEEADAYIAGYMIMNDMSARTLQMDEMKLNLGPAKGKDFSTVIGPWLVTPDELEPFKTAPKPGHVGNSYNLKMKGKLNGEEISTGNVSDMDWTFAEILERCAYGADILPGDVIGSGTVGTGCFLELNGTGMRLNPDTYKPRWLQEGDVMELEIDGLGVLTNTIRREKSDFSIIAKYRR